MPTGVEIIAFADDVALIVTASVPVLLEESLEEAFGRVNAWMLNHGIELAANKTEALVITKKRKFNNIRVKCSGVEIASGPSLKYLSVQVDSRLGFLEHGGDSQVARLPVAEFEGPATEVQEVTGRWSYVQTSVCGPLLGAESAGQRLAKVGVSS